MLALFSDATMRPVPEVRTEPGWIDPPRPEGKLRELLRRWAGGAAMVGVFVGANLRCAGGEGALGAAILLAALACVEEMKTEAKRNKVKAFRQEVFDRFFFIFAPKNCPT